MLGADGPCLKRGGNILDPAGRERGHPLDSAPTILGRQGNASFRMLVTYS